MATPVAVFVQTGDIIDYTPGSAVAAGDVVVQNSLVGIATEAIEANALGSLTIAGVFEFPKEAGSRNAISTGELCYWDAENEVITTTSDGNTLVGKAIADAGDDDEVVRVRLSM